MESQTKACPVCARDILSTARTCPFCQTSFEVKIIGYCNTCHGMAQADENGKCLRCGYPVTEARVDSKVSEPHRAGAPAGGEHFALPVASPVAAPSTPEPEPPDLGYSHPGRYIGRRLRTGEQVLFHTRLHWMLLVSAAFSLIIGVGVYLFFRSAADTPYPEEYAKIFNRSISPGDTIMDVIPNGIYGGYVIAALFILGGLRRVVTYFGSELAITSHRLLGRSAAFISAPVDIPLSSIASVIYGRAFLGNYGRLTLSYLPRRTLSVPYLPHPQMFRQRLCAAMPARAATLEKQKWGRILAVILLASLLIAGGVFGVFYFTGGREQLQPVAMVDFDTISQYPKERRVSIEGYLELPSSTNCDPDCMLYLVDYGDPENKLIIFVPQAAHSSTPAPGEMKSLPYRYAKTDLAVRLEDGSDASHGADVRLTGKVWKTTTGKLCLLVSGAAKGSIPDTPTPLPTPTPTPTNVPVLVAFDDICTRVGQYVSVEGQIGHLPYFMVCSGGRCTIDLHAVNRGLPELRINIPFGVGNNKMERLPNQYEDSDLRVHTADGQIAQVGDVLILTGLVREDPSDLENVMDCNLLVGNIEKGKPAPTLTPTPRPTTTPTPTPTAAPVKVTFNNVCDYQGKLVIVQGKLAPLSFMTLCHGTCPLRLTEAGGQWRELMVYIGFGGGVNEMDPLPDKYTNKDLKVHTTGGQIVGVNSLVEILGRVGEYSNATGQTLKCNLQVLTVTVP